MQIRIGLLVLLGFAALSLVDTMNDARAFDDVIKQTGKQITDRIPDEDPSDRDAGDQEGKLLPLPPDVDSVRRKSQSDDEPNDLSPRKMATAIETVLLSRELCGVELTDLSRRMLSKDELKKPRPFAEDREVLANLWRETFKCNVKFAGQNCFAARWQMCQRAYEEYGPNGILVEGMIAAIIKK